MKPVAYQLVDLLGREGLPDDVAEAVRIVLPLAAAQMREVAKEAREGEVAALKHDLERVMDRENRYLNALMEITGLERSEATEIATKALCGHEPRRLASVDTLPKGQDAKQGLAGTEGSAVANGETPTPGMPTIDQDGGEA